MTLASGELYELFLSLSSARVSAAQSALSLPSTSDRRAALIAALGPVAVDAALLGAEGVSVLASAVARAADPQLPLAKSALGE